VQKLLEAKNPLLEKNLFGRSLKAADWKREKVEKRGSTNLGSPGNGGIRAFWGTVVGEEVKVRDSGTTGSLLEGGGEMKKGESGGGTMFPPILVKRGIPKWYVTGSWGGG